MMFLTLFLLFFNDSSKCLDLITYNKISEAKILYESLKESQNENMEFLNAYFSRDVESSIKVYEELYLKTQNKKLKFLTTRKLYEYYYAKGLYVKAQILKTSLDGFNITMPVSNLKKVTNNYVLQCGVFGLESNALALKEKIATIVSNKVYLSKDIINNQEVIRVFVGDLDSYQLAETIKNKIDDALSLKSMIKELKE